MGFLAVGPHAAHRGGRVLDRPVPGRDRRRPGAVGHLLGVAGLLPARAGSRRRRLREAVDDQDQRGRAPSSPRSSSPCCSSTWCWPPPASSWRRPALAGLAIGLALTVVHLLGILITGTSVNPARSLGPALIVGGQALSQVWLFIVAPLVGGAIAAVLYRYFSRRGVATASCGLPPDRSLIGRGSVSGDDRRSPPPTCPSGRSAPRRPGSSIPTELRWRPGWPAAGRHRRPGPRPAPAAPAPPGPAGRPGRRPSWPGPSAAGT